MPEIVIEKIVLKIEYEGNVLLHVVTVVAHTRSVRNLEGANPRRAA